MDSENKKNRVLRGTVVSDRMTKTVVVEVNRLRKHPKYKKYFKITKRYKAHDEKGEYRVGDKVSIQETKPTSRDKRWKVINRILN